MNSKLLIGVVVLLAGVAAGWYVLKGGYQLGGGAMKKNEVVESPTPATQEATTPATITSEGTPAESVDKGGTTVTGKVTVTYTDSGFSPKTITVKRGTAVTFVNQSGVSMWVASAVHPTHLLLPEFDQLKSVSKGSSYDYVFVKVGTWKYHNHANASDTGTIVVTE